MTRTKGSLGKHHVERLIPAAFKIKRETWSTFCRLYSGRTSSLLREYVERLIKDAE